MRYLSARVLGLFALLLCPLPAAAQAPVDVPTSEPVYRDLELLIGAGLVDTVVVGQRPFSRPEVARMAAEARRELERRPDAPPLLRRIAERVAEQYPVEEDAPAVRLRPVETVEVEALHTNAPFRAFRRNDTGELDAMLNPLLDGRGGRRLAEGTNLAMETTHLLEVGDFLAVHARPRWHTATGEDPRGPADPVSIQELAAHFSVANVAVSVGRQRLLWGQGREVGLLFSSNAPALDMIRAGNDRPIVLPWLFRHLGPFRYTFAFADLGREQHFPGSNIVAHKLSARPFPNLEIAGALFNEWGGEGAPGAPLWERVADNLPIFIDYYIPGLEFQASNKLTQAEVRWGIPNTGGAQLYVELGLDDADLRRARSMFWEDAGYVVGLTAPMLTPGGVVRIGGEYHHTGIRFYRHGQYLTGVAKDRFLLGAPLGPTANAVYLDASWDTGGRHFIALQGAWEGRTGDLFYITGEPSWGFHLKEDRPDEQRLRTAVRWEAQPTTAPLLVYATLGAERATNFDFVAGEGRTSTLGGVGLRYRF
jgi:hypothetical protein